MTHEPTSPIQLTIFHTNDIHGRLEAFARLSHFARRLQAEAESQGRQVFLWDAGDAADRRLRICSATKGAAFGPILKAAGYSLQTMGNAISLTYGPQAMKAVAARAGFPILAANFRDQDGPLVEGLCESALIPLPHGLTLGIIGLTAAFQEANHFYEIFNLHLPDFYTLAGRLAARLKEMGAALVVVLSHLGLDDDRRLAESVPGIHLIIGGHSHSRLPAGEERNGVLIAQAGEYAGALGRVDLALDPHTGRVLARTAQVLDVPPGEPPDPLVLQAITTAEQEVARLMAQPIGVLQSDLELDHFGECGIGNLAADALREALQAEAALVCSGQFHQGMPAGVVTFGQLDAACFSTANPGLTEVSGAQLQAALERGLDPAIQRFEMRGLRGTPFGIPQISGLQVTYDPGAEVGHKVRSVLVQGQPLDLHRSYRLAHTDPEVIPEVGYLVLEAGQAPRYTVPTILREVIEAYLGLHSPLAHPEPGRWQPLLA